MNSETTEANEYRENENHIILIPFLINIYILNHPFYLITTL